MWIVIKTDIAWDVPQADIEKAITDCGGKIVTYVDQGPAGGNHYVEAEFRVYAPEDVAHITKWFDWYFQDGPEGQPTAVMAIVRNEKFIEFRSVHDWDNAKWQVIYQTKVDGKVMDYCREPYSDPLTEAEIKARVEQVLKARPELCGAYIERW